MRAQDYAQAGDRTPYEQSVLRGLAELLAVGRELVSLPLAAAAAGRARSGAWDKVIAQLSKEGLIERPEAGKMRLSEEGRAVAPKIDAVLTPQELQDRLRKIMVPYQISVFDAALDRARESDQAIPLPELAELSGRSMSGAWDRVIAALIKMEILERPEKGKVKAAAWLFLE